MNEIAIEVDHTTDLSKAGVLTEAELEEQVFPFGNTTDGKLWYGERVAELVSDTPGCPVVALVYGHIPPDAARRLVAESLDEQGEANAHRYAVDPPAWVVVTRHEPACPQGGDATVCGCQPADEPPGWYMAGATEDTPSAVPVTPVSLREVAA
jgi:hypothetical protein